MLTAAAGLANVEMLARYDARNPVALRKLLNAGAELRPFTEATMDACLKASNEVNAEAAAANPDSIPSLYSAPGSRKLAFESIHPADTMAPSL